MANVHSLQCCSYLCIHISGQRRTPFLERRQTTLVYHQHRFCHKWVLSRPWFSSLHTSPLCREKKISLVTPLGFGLFLLTHQCDCKWNLISAVSPNKTRLWPVAETPSVGSEIFPAYVTRVMPQGAHLKEKEKKRLKHSSMMRRFIFHSIRNSAWKVPSGPNLGCNVGFFPRPLLFTVCPWMHT